MHMSPTGFVRIADDAVLGRSRRWCDRETRIHLLAGASKILRHRRRRLISLHVSY